MFRCFQEKQKNSPVLVGEPGVGKTAIKKETNSESKERLSKPDKELESMRSAIREIKVKWQNEKDVIQDIRNIKEEIEHLGIDEQKAEREGDLTRVLEVSGF